MGTRSYVMITKSFSEEITVKPVGPRNDLTYTTTCSYESGRRFRTSVELRPRFSARYYITTMTVNQATDEFTYREYMEFQPRQKVRGFGETIFAYPKTVKQLFTTTLTHWANSSERTYTVAVELVPAQKLSKRMSSVEENSLCTSVTEAKTSVNGISTHAFVCS